MTKPLDFQQLFASWIYEGAQSWQLTMPDLLPWQEFCRVTPHARELSDLSQQISGSGPVAGTLNPSQISYFHGFNTDEAGDPQFLRHTHIRMIAALRMALCMAYMQEPYLPSLRDFLLSAGEHAQVLIQALEAGELRFDAMRGDIGERTLRDIMVLADDDLVSADPVAIAQQIATFYDERIFVMVPPRDAVMNEEAKQPLGVLMGALPRDLARDFHSHVCAVVYGRLGQALNEGPISNDPVEFLTVYSQLNKTLKGLARESGIEFQAPAVVTNPWWPELIRVLQGLGIAFEALDELRHARAVMTAVLLPEVRSNSDAMTTLLSERAYGYPNDAGDRDLHFASVYLESRPGVSGAERTTLKFTSLPKHSYECWPAAAPAATVEQALRRIATVAREQAEFGKGARLSGPPYLQVADDAFGPLCAALGDEGLCYFRLGEHPQTKQATLRPVICIENGDCRLYVTSQGRWQAPETSGGLLAEDRKAMREHFAIPETWQVYDQVEMIDAPLMRSAILLPEMSNASTASHDRKPSRQSWFAVIAHDDCCDHENASWQTRDSGLVQWEQLTCADCGNMMLDIVPSIALTDAAPTTQQLAIYQAHRVVEDISSQLSVPTIQDLQSALGGPIDLTERRKLILDQRRQELDARMRPAQDHDLGIYEDFTL